MFRRYDDTFFTEEQVRVMRMYFDGISVEEIARRLSRSKADIYVMLKRVREVVRKCRRTLEVYASMRKFIEFEVEPGIGVLEVVEVIMREADNHGIKVRERSARLMMNVIDVAKGCNVLDGTIVLGRLRVRLSKDGEVSISCVEEVPPLL